MRLRWRFGIGFFMLAGVLMPARASTVTWVVLPELAVIAVDIFGYETIPTLDGTGKKEVRRTLDTPKVRQVKATDIASGALTYHGAGRFKPDPSKLKQGAPQGGGYVPIECVLGPEAGGYLPSVCSYINCSTARLDGTLSITDTMRNLAATLEECWDNSEAQRTIPIQLNVIYFPAAPTPELPKSLQVTAYPDHFESDSAFVPVDVFPREQSRDHGQELDSHCRQGSW